MSSSTSRQPRGKAKKKLGKKLQNTRELLGRKLAIALVPVAIVYLLIANLVAAPKEHIAKVTFLADEDFITTFLKDVENAEDEILCALYMFKTDGRENDPTSLMLNALYTALRRGVYVGMLLDIDDRKGSITTSINTTTGDKLKIAGAVVKYDDPNKRLHTKMCVIDNKISLIGSHNYTYSAISRNSEVSVRIDSEDVAYDALKYMKNLGLKR